MIGERLTVIACAAGCSATGATVDTGLFTYIMAIATMAAAMTMAAGIVSTFVCFVSMGTFYIRDDKHERVLNEMLNENIRI